MPTTQSALEPDDHTTRGVRQGAYDTMRAEILLRRTDRAKRESREQRMLFLRIGIYIAVLAVLIYILYR
jgi:hypothetical protein